jgi:U4/U6 small nuclear ribonucleoprotein PRP3
MMALTLNPQELEDLKPYVDKAVKRYLGLSEPALVNAAISLLSSGADKPQFTNKIKSLHPSLSERAHKLTDTIFEIASEYLVSLQQHQQKVAKKR